MQVEKAFSTQLGLYKVGDAVKRAPISDIVAAGGAAVARLAVLGLSSRC